MNRLQHVDLALDTRCSLSQGNHVGNVFEPHEISSRRFFIPLHYEVNYAYPLVIWLHGPTGSEREVAQVMPYISTRNYVAAAPRGGVKHSAKHANGDPTFTWDQRPSTIQRAYDEVQQCIALAKQRFHIADERVFLVGNDVGGTMALRIAFSAPRQFAGVVSIGGGLPKERPLSKIEVARSVPVLISHGRDSDTYSTDEVCDDLRLLHTAGISATLRQYPCGQEVTTKMLSDLNVWLMEQVAGVPAEDTAFDDPTHVRVRNRN